MAKRFVSRTPLQMACSSILDQRLNLANLARYLGASERGCAFNVCTDDHIWAMSVAYPSLSNQAISACNDTLQCSRSRQRA